MSHSINGNAFSVIAARFAWPFLLLLSATALLATSAAAETVSGPHEVVDNQLTTTQVDAPSGFHYIARYHAAGDPGGDPP